MRLLLQIAASSSEPAVQAGALTAFKAVVTLREGNQTAAGEGAVLRLLDLQSLVEANLKFRKKLWMRLQP